MGALLLLRGLVRDEGEVPKRPPPERGERCPIGQEDPAHGDVGAREGAVVEDAASPKLSSPSSDPYQPSWAIRNTELEVVYSHSRPSQRGCVPDPRAGCEGVENQGIPRLKIRGFPDRHPDHASLYYESDVQTNLLASRLQEARLSRVINPPSLMPEFWGERWPTNGPDPAYHGNFT